MGEPEAGAAGAVSYHIDRFDFIPPGRCSFCGRPLPSCTAYIVRDADGKEYRCGPVCVTTHVARLERAGPYPDLTRVAEPSPDWGQRGQGRIGGGRRGAAQAAALPRAGSEEVEYLVLRYEKLKELPGMKLRTLDPLYGRYLAGGVTEEDRRHLAALIRKVRIERPEYSPENLAAVYAYSFWIRIALERLPVERHEFLKKMLLHLLKTLHLTVAQAEGVNRWLAKIEGLPRLDPHGFVRNAPSCPGT